MHIIKIVLSSLYNTNEIKPCQSNDLVVFDNNNIWLWVKYGSAFYYVLMQCRALPHNNQFINKYITMLFKKL